MRRYKDLTLAQLRSFSSVCRLGTYAAAARELALTSPAIWEQLNGLQRYYGRKLLVRRGNGVAPTVDGEHLLKMIRPVLAGLDSTRDAMLQHGGTRPESLTIATNLRVLAEEISQGLATFQRDNSDIRLRLVFTGNDVHERVESGEADVGFTLEPGPDQDYGATIDYQPAGEVDYLLVLPRRHPLRRGSALRVEHLTRYPLVLGDSAAYSRHRVEEVLHRHLLKSSVRVAVETSSDEYTLACVRAGMGIGITIGAGRGPLFGGLAVRSLRRWFGTARLGFVWRRGAFISPGQRELTDAIRSTIRA
ncbi:MAG TPA: LysR family transcriptional regulator [Pirellulaceae bacterium]|jgi:DNA-binding transcriptional LysR family regulator